jgi:hypothetical protein
MIRQRVPIRCNHCQSCYARLIPLIVRGRAELGWVVLAGRILRATQHESLEHLENVSESLSKFELYS